MANKSFKQNVRLIEIEVHSYCNRECWWCPNSFIDRKSKTKYLDENIYLSLLEDLASIGYNRKISYSRYNEPFADEIIYKRIEQAKEILPHAKLHSNTNGDYTDRDSIDRLQKAGLRSLAIQLYLTNDSQTPEQRLAEIIKCTGLGFTKSLTQSDFWILQYENMKVVAYYRNFKADGTDRCDIEVKKIPARTRPCYIPTKAVYVDYNGSVVPCCNIRSDYDKHRNLVLGSLATKDIFAIYASKKAVEWRELVRLNGVKPYPCDRCGFGN